MKIKRYPINKMSLTAFAETYNLTMIIRERIPNNVQSCPFYAYFEHTEVKIDCFLIGECGNGHTENGAINDYAKRISGKCLVIKAATSERKEIQVPILEGV